MYKIGIDLGGTNIAVGIVDKENNIVIKDSVPTHAERNPDEIVKDMALLCARMCKDKDIDHSQIESVGIASPGSVDPENGVIVYANNINMIEYPIAEKFRSFFKLEKVFVENDANCAALGEFMAGCGKGTNDFVMITLGTGVGGGIIIDGKIYSGFNHVGGELGHIVIEHNGWQCTCGRKGCWETYSSATGLIRMTKERMIADKNSEMWKICEGDISRVDGKTSFKAASMGDKSAREVCAEYIDYLACGIVNIINTFQPEIVCIGGGVSHEGPGLLEPLTELTDRFQYGNGGNKRGEVRLAELGNDAGIIGAAALH